MYEYDLESAPGGKAIHYERSEVESICFDELKKHGLIPNTPMPIKIDRLFEKRYGIFPEYTYLEEGIWGKTVFGTRGAAKVYISRELAEATDSVSQTQLSSTLAHEAGHCLLHGHLFALHLQDGCLCRSENVEVERGRRKHLWHEYQANMCIGPLLMPRNLVMGFWRTSPVQDQELKTRDAAKTFGVSLAVARIRLTELALLH